MIEDWLTFWRSRPLKLALSMLMLTMSVLFTADFFDLRGDADRGIKDARKSMAETLAVQLSTLASTSDAAAIRYSVTTFVNRNPDVAAAALLKAGGNTVAEFGDQAQMQEFSTGSTLTHMTVPIFNGNKPWGEVKVVFVSANNVRMELRYFIFIATGCLLVYLLFLRKALAQLDPSRVVPGRVNSAFNMFSEGVVILDDQLRILLVNDAAAAVVGKPVDDLIGQKMDEWPWQKDDDWQAPWATAMHSGLNLNDQPLRLSMDEKRPQLLMVNCAAVGNDEEGMRGVLVTFDNMSAIEQKNQELAITLRQLRRTQDHISRKNKELEALATQDPLTGLANRRALMTNFEREYTKAQREQRPLSCIMVDIDFFKRINDSLGHSAGDEVICAVANTLVAECREYDVIGRYGGEEFVIIVPDLPEAGAVEVAERLRIAIEHLGSDVKVPGKELTASFGVAELRSDVNGMADLIERADQALYAAKQGGRNRVLTFDSKVTKLSVPAANNVAEENSDSETLTRLVELEAIVDQRTKDLEMLREYDTLTGIPKRALFLQRIETEIQRARRFERNTGILSLEIKDLNRMVSTFGHAASDQLVIDVVERLQDCLRSTDAVTEITEEHSLSRITNNEYGVLLSDLDKSGQAMPVITRVRRMLADPFQVGGQKVYVGANIGIALYPQGGKTAVELLENASIARIKATLSTDKVSHSFSSASLDEVSRDYVQLESDLYDAVQNREFEVYYQPQFDLIERRVSGMEALIRWHHPERGFVSPVEFIPIAEGNGLIQEISEFVLSQSIAQIRTWQDMGLDNLRMSVNLSPKQLREPTLVPDILAELSRHDVSTSRLELELTETSVIESPQRARIVLGQLRETGISVSMDDFGTGYSSLSLLADLPLDAVKIDRSFVDAMSTSQRSRAIVESVINMAHAMQLRVVGEGVETNEQLAMLTALGCNEVQGYLFSKPLPAADLTEFLRKQSWENTDVG